MVLSNMLVSLEFRLKVGDTDEIVTQKEWTNAKIIDDSCIYKLARKASRLATYSNRLKDVMPSDLTPIQYRFGDTSVHYEIIDRGGIIAVRQEKFRGWSTWREMPVVSNE